MAVLFAGMEELNRPLGAKSTSLSLVNVLSMFSRRDSTNSGILHPNEFSPASAHLIAWSSSSLELIRRLMRGMLADFSTNSRTVAAGILMSAAVSDPSDEIFSPPFFGKRMGRKGEVGGC